MYRTVKGKIELTKWLKDNGYKQVGAGVWRKIGSETFTPKMFQYCGKEINMEKNPFCWEEGFLKSMKPAKPPKKFNSLEQLQKDYKELQEKYGRMTENRNQYAESCASAEKAIAELNREKEYLIDEVGELALQVEEMKTEKKYRDTELSENSVKTTAIEIERDELKADLADMKHTADKFRVEWIETNGKYLALRDILETIIKGE